MTIIPEVQKGHAGCWEKGAVEVDGGSRRFHQMRRRTKGTRNYCIATYGGKVIGIAGCTSEGSGNNWVTRKYNTHSGVNQTSSRHAEVELVRKLQKTITVEKSRKIGKIKIYSLRISITGEFSRSCCCSECAKMLYRMGIRSVVYYDGEQFVRDKPVNIITYAKPSSGTWNRRCGQ